MPTRTLLPLIIAALFAAHAHAQNPGAPKQQGQNSEPKTAGASEARNAGDTTDPAIVSYRKKVIAAVGTRWTDQIRKQAAELKAGTVVISMGIDAAGKLKIFRVTENTSNAAHAKLVEKCVRESDFGPPPPVALKDGVYEEPMRFMLK